MARHHDSPPGNGIFRGIAWIFGGLLVAVWIGGYGVPYLIGWMIFSSIPDRYREVVEHPDQDFAKITGLAWPAGATVLSVDDDHGGLLGEGTFYLVAEVDRATLDQWLAGPPPFGQPAWLNGPMPEYTHGWVSFGTETESNHGSATNGVPNPLQWKGDPDVIRVLSSPAIRYAIVDRTTGPTNVEGDNCDLLALDFEKNRLWLCRYDW